MTRRERLERKLERRREWAESRQADAQARFQASHDLVKNIPMGQPILVGHHSEKGHRALLARSDNHMRKGCESQAMAEHHESKADGLERQLDNTIFSDDENAVEAIEAKIAKLEAKREWNNAVNKIIRAKPKNECTPEKIAALQKIDPRAREESIRGLFEADFCGRIGIPSYVNQNLGGNITRLRKRLEYVKDRQERTAQAENSSSGVLVEVFDKYCRVTFAEKPAREVLDALKAAGFRWGAGCWSGETEKLPACVQTQIDTWKP